MAMKAGDAFKALIEAIYANTHGKVFGWHGQNVTGNLEGLLEDSIENQLSFLEGVATRGTDRVIQERISATAVNTLEQAQERATYADLLTYEPGTRVGVSRLNSAQDCAEAAVINALKDGKSEKAAARRAEFGLELKTDKNGKVIGLTNTESEAFQAYLAETAGKEPFATIGVKEWEKRQADKAAKKDAKDAKNAL